MHRESPLVKSPFSQRLKACAIGSTLAALFLLWMIFLSRSFSRDTQVAVWMGIRKLAPAEWALFTAQYYKMYSLVALYLVGHFMMWLGYGYLILRRTALLGGVVIVVGLLCTVFDLTEYGLRGAMMKGIHWNIEVSSSWVLMWWLVRETSIWLIYLGSFIAAIGVFDRGTWSYALLGLAFIGALTIPCIYVYGMGRIWFVWLILWHVVSALFLWRKALELEHHDAPLFKV